MNYYKKGHVLLILLIYKILIEFVYISSISETFSYGGLSLNINYVSGFVAYILFITTVLFAPTRKGIPSTYLYLIVMVFIYIPLNTYFWLNNMSFIYICLVTISLIIIAYITKINISNLNIDFQKINSLLLMLILSLFLIIGLYLVIIRGGIDARAFNFNEIYALREENRLSSINLYFLNWFTKIIFPLFTSLFLYYKKYSVVFILITLQLMIFLSFGNKAFLFSIAFVLLIFAIKKKLYTNLCIGLTILVSISTILWELNISDILYKAIPYRLLFIPAQLQYHYYDFFSVNEKLNYADGVLGKIFGIVNNYNMPGPFIISNYYYGNSFSANTGIFSDAYSNGGVIAMILISIVLGFIFKFIDITTRNIEAHVVVASMSYTMFVLNDTGLQTTLLTGGLLIILFLFVLINNLNYKFKEVEGIINNNEEIK